MYIPPPPAGFSMYLSFFLHTQDIHLRFLDTWAMSEWPADECKLSRVFS